MKLSKLEAKIMTAFEQRPNHVWDLDEIAKVAYKGRQRPEYWRTSLQCLMRGLAMKTVAHAKSVRRTSGLGRGNKAEYQLSSGGRKRAFLSHAARR